MERPGGPPWYAWQGPAARPRTEAPQMRVSDAERHEIADQLGTHYAEGRLDENEFKERLDAAMRAKTYGDLAGLTGDLPTLAPPPPPPAPARRPLRMAELALLTLVALSMAGLAVATHGASLFFGFLFFMLLRGSRYNRRVRHHHHHDRGALPTGNGSWHQHL